ncbi:hypothetical protein A9R05_44925 (plasmid) [Burkholderia sp. KK1]|nr:hypothetical protein A9R05_44925 [Burkholderia sp. KK1]
MNQHIIARKKSLRTFITEFLIHFVLGAILPLSLTLGGKYAGWFDTAPELDLFPTCLIISLLCGWAFVYKNGGFSMEEQVYDGPSSRK